jgi:hypothetical protein
MNARVQLCLRLYRALARAYPQEFQMLYGEDLDRMGEDAAPEIWRRHGVLGLARLLADIALRLPAEYFSELRGDARYALRMLAKSPGFAGGRGANTIADVTSAIASLDSRLTLFNVASMDERLDQFNTVVRLAKVCTAASESWD